MTTAALRLKAAGLIEELGHTRTGRYESYGRLCLIGALCRAAGFDPYENDTDSRPLVKEAVHEMGLRYSSPNDPNDERPVAGEWNDNHSRREVLARLREGLL